MYIAKVLNKIERGPGSWKTSRIGIFRIEKEKEEQVGEYDRNYPALFNTFYHFRYNEKDLALYSPHYTVTRLMELPSCQDIGGEEPDAFGFCPTDYFVPTYIEQEYIWDYESETEQRGRRKINLPEEKDLQKHETTREWTDQRTGEKLRKKDFYRPLTPLLYHPFGFVAGCIWGDDSSWKIQFLDLTEATKGIIKRDDRFGYIELPDNQSLKEAVDMYDYGHDDEEDYSNYIRINVMQTFDLRTGEKV